MYVGLHLDLGFRSTAASFFVKATGGLIDQLCLTAIFIRLVTVHIFKCFAQALKDDLKCKVIFMLENDAVLL